MQKIVLTLFIAFTAHCTFAQMENNPETKIIMALRAACNEAIAKHDIKSLAKYWLDDMVLVRGNSTHLTGKDSIIAAWKKLFNKNPKVVYARTPSQIIISSNDTLAWETGTWKATNSYSNGGNYSAMWKKLNDGWKIQAELFVSLY